MQRPNPRGVLLRKTVKGGRAGESNVSILWTVSTFDGDLNPLGETSPVTAESVNDVITLTGDAQFFSICATNTSDERATLDFDVVSASQ